jgi:hypothetical protein
MCDGGEGDGGPDEAAGGKKANSFCFLPRSPPTRAMASVMELWLNALAAFEVLTIVQGSYRKLPEVRARAFLC